MVRGRSTMSDPSSGLDPVAALAGEFAERYRRGERPSVGEYAARYPELADQICDLFPALIAMEELGSVEGPRSRLSGESSLMKALSWSRVGIRPVMSR